MQTLKDLMRNAAPHPVPADLDAETERLSGSHDNTDAESDLSQSSDPIPDNFMGIPDAPAFDGSSSSETQLCQCNECVLYFNIVDTVKFA